MVSVRRCATRPRGRAPRSALAPSHVVTTSPLKLSRRCHRAGEPAWSARPDRSDELSAGAEADPGPRCTFAASSGPRWRKPAPLGGRAGSRFIPGGSRFSPRKQAIRNVGNRQLSPSDGSLVRESTASSSRTISWRGQTHRAAAMEIVTVKLALPGNIVGKRLSGDFNEAAVAADGTAASIIACYVFRYSPTGSTPRLHPPPPLLAADHRKIAGGVVQALALQLYHVSAASCCR